MTPTEPPRTIVVGLDGADFHLLDPWITEGELPTLERILDDGVSTRLESVLPPVTSPNWKAYSTGKNPGKLGIFWWWNVDTRNERTYRPSERYNANTEYWELIAEDQRVGVIGVPTTYPPKSIGSFVVSGGPDGQDAGFTHPPSLESELRSRFDYRISRDFSLREGTDEAYREVLEIVDATFRSAKYLMEKDDLDFLQVATYHINTLHHHLWDDHVTLEAWKLIDEHLESFYDEGTNIILLSDHGMARTRTIFRINQWLMQEGYLSCDTTTSDTLRDFGIYSDRVKVLLSRLDRRVPTLDLERIVDQVVPQWVVDRLPNKAGELGPSKHSQINWKESRALASGMGPVYLLEDPGTEAYESLRTELINRLEALTDPADRPIADAVYRAEEIYSGPFVDEGPDIVIDQARGTHVVEGIGAAEIFSENHHHLRAMNAREGILAASGPDFTTGSVDPVSILDLAPTLLHLEDCAVPDDMDGRVRTELFAEDSEPAVRKPQYFTPNVLSEARNQRNDPESENVDARLRDLGYL